MYTRRTFSKMVLGAPFVAPALAQTAYPNKEIKVLVGAAAGGITDIIARSIGDYANRKFGARFVVDNNGAASGNIAFAQLARSEPDGYTLGLAAAGNIVINPHLFKGLRFDPLKELTPISALAHAPQVIVVNAKTPINSLADLVQEAKKKPGGVTYGSAGIGTTNHLAGARLARTLNIEMTHVPYRGVSQAVTDLMSGNIMLMSVAVGTVIGGIVGGQLRSIAVATSERIAELPKTPTAAEAGLKNYNLTTWFGLVGPAGLPPSTVELLRSWVREMLTSAEEQKKLADKFLVPMNESTSQFAARIRAEYQEWDAAIKEIGVSLN